MGGNHKGNMGGGSNYLCLRSDPIYRSSDEDKGDYRSEIYGTEYRLPESSVHYHEVPCAVCSITRRQVLMMPGTNRCDDGWTTEYVGFIATEQGWSLSH